MKTIALSLIFPPGIYIAISLFIVIIALRERNKVKKSHEVIPVYINLIILAAIINSALVYALSIEPIKDLLVTPLEDSYLPITEMQIKEADAIVVLGGGINDNSYVGFSAGGSSYGAPSYASTARLIEAARIHKQALTNNQPLPIIVSGGTLNSNIRTEADVYNEFLLSIGIEKESIILEGKSKNTYENALYTKEICDESSMDKIILVTTASHMRRSVIAFKKAGLDTIPAPTDYFSSRSRYDLPSFLPDSYQALQIKRALWEWIGILYYRFK